MKKIVLVAGLVSALALSACDGKDSKVTNSTSTVQDLGNGSAVVTNTTTTSTKK